MTTVRNGNLARRAWVHRELHIRRVRRIFPINRSYLQAGWWRNYRGRHCCLLSASIRVDGKDGRELSQIPFTSCGIYKNLAGMMRSNDATAIFEGNSTPAISEA